MSISLRAVFLQIVSVASATIAIFAAPAAFAGQRCDPQIATPQAHKYAADAAANTLAALATQRRSIALIARIGQDLSQHGLLYSHVGFAIFDADQAHPGEWRVTHLLNDCGSDRGALYREGLLNFYQDSPLSYQSKVIFLKPQLEQQVIDALAEHNGKAVFEPRYSVIAKPHSKTRQNSTAWVLEVIAAASGAATDSRAEASAILRAHHYQADTIQISYSQRILGGFTRANAVFTDHSLGTRLSGAYPVSTVHSVFSYLREHNLIALEATLTPKHAATIPGE